MLKQRLLTAAVLIPLIVWGVLGLPDDLFVLILALLLALGAWEWAALACIDGTARRMIYVVFIVACLGLVWYAMGVSDQIAPVILVSSFAGWCIALYWVLRYPGTTTTGKPWHLASWVLRFPLGVMILVVPFVALVTLRGHENYGPPFVLFLISLMWVADSGAYFSGKKWGRHKLAPLVSPGKTWEGVGGAVVGTLLVSIIGAVLFRFSIWQTLFWIGLCVFTLAFSILGDLFESLCKRQARIKDSGYMLPGHGGLLDRIDSLTAAAPIFVLGLFVMGVEA